MAAKKTLFLFAGETSGDKLAAGLIRHLKKLDPSLRFVGVAGPAMQAEGCQAVLETADFEVMGFTEVIKQLPRLLKLRSYLRKYLKQNPPDVYIGIDYAELNMLMAKYCHSLGIQTIHYVSPSVWAWRQNRVKKIKSNVDLMLCLFPFEQDFYRKHGVPASCVGHSLADKVPLEIDRAQAKRLLGIDPGQPLLALLPGSRHMELEQLGRVFLQTARKCLDSEPNLQFISVQPNHERHKQMQKLIKQVTPNLKIQLIIGDMAPALSAADIALVASGTATFETMLYRCPMIVAAKLHTLSYWIIKALIKIPYVSLPNILSGKRIVEEYIQADVIPEVMAKQLLTCLHDEAYKNAMLNEFKSQHMRLKLNADYQAAKAVVEHLK